MTTTAATQLLDKYEHLLKTYGLVRSDNIDLSTVIEKLITNLALLPQILGRALRQLQTNPEQYSAGYSKTLRSTARHMAATQQHLERIRLKLETHRRDIDKHVARHIKDTGFLALSLTRYEQALPIDRHQQYAAMRHMQARVTDVERVADRNHQHVNFVEEHLARLIGELEKLKEHTQEHQQPQVKELDYFCREFATEFATCAHISEFIRQRKESLDKISFKTALEERLDDDYAQTPAEPISRVDGESTLAESPFVVDSRMVKPETLVK